jgi:putative PIN family toxin of toxin-antitoxin system
MRGCLNISERNRENVKVVLDSNVFLVSLPRKSEFRLIFDGLICKKFDLVLSTDILYEYAELIERKANREVASQIMEMLINLENVTFQELYFKWNLIEADPDDNKFVDVAIASGAEFLVTEDRHFQALRDIKFPFVQVVGIRQFSEFLGRASTPLS